MSSGKRKPTGVIDVALIQGLVCNSEVADIVADYDHLMVDECHHLSAASFELVARPLTQDGGRNDLIFDDVLKSLEARRSPVVLTEQKDDLDYLQQRFSPFVKNLVVLRGGMSASDRKTANVAFRVSDDRERLILATGRYIGEGFDEARLGTLFVTMLIAWKGTLAQYVGLLFRVPSGQASIRCT